MSNQLSQQELRELAIKTQIIFKETGKFPKKNMEKLWLAILPFVNKHASQRSQKTNGQTRPDLIQVSYEALCSAVRNYDSKKMDNFFNYCVQWIIAYVKSENIKNTSMFRFSSRKSRKLFFKISQVKELSIEQQAKILGVSEYDLAAFSAATKVPKSILKKRTSEDSELESEEYLSADIPNPDQLFEFKEIYSNIKRVFDDFESELYEKNNSREIEIFQLLRRVGVTEKGNFKSDPEETLPQNYADIAAKYGVSREAVRQMSEKIRDRLRYRLQKNGIDEKAHHAFI